MIHVRTEKKFRFHFRAAFWVKRLKKKTMMQHLAVWNFPKNATRVKLHVQTRNRRDDEPDFKLKTPSQW